MIRWVHCGDFTRAARWWPGVLALIVLIAACTSDNGEWSKNGVEPETRQADLLACQAETDRWVEAAAASKTFHRTVRYIYFEPQYGLFGPSAANDDSSVRRQVESEIAAKKRRQWRAHFGACLEDRGYRYTRLAKGD